ncbi:hypothetical protein [Streptomyces formicae]|uniref:Regulatory protein n=1 Tax=Streptomyces formicae TaxID=1616117 RepID=A0ABY3WR18_9ACTN|nr:hypothetical protein [Streptomyces formicae]UNM13104.1 hypothetical protein J4032_17805 [Streptomyces formicae]UNM13242.1 hypothetical protein J4032_18665 [Streptomyces formicae]
MSDSELAAQVAAKLERITKEIDELHKVKAALEDLQQHLGTRSLQTVAAPRSAGAASPTRPVTVPAARRAESDAPAAGVARMPRTMTAGGGKAKPAAGPAQGTSGQKRSTRASRVLALLDEQPHTVRQVAQLLAREHPNDTAPETVVRSTLENSLVARGLALRSKRGRSVFYSRPAITAGISAQTRQAHSPEAGDDSRTGPA